MSLRLDKLIDFDDDSLWNQSGNFEVIDSVFDSLNYARSHYTNIIAPMPELPKSKMNVYYWACFNMNQLARYTDENIEFTIRIDENKKVLFNAWYPENGVVSKRIEAIKSAIENEELESLFDAKLIGNPISSTAKPRYMTGEHIKAVRKARSLYKYIKAPYPEVSEDKLPLYLEACYAFNALSRYTGEKVEFIFRTKKNGKIHCDAWCHRESKIKNYIPAIVKLIEEENMELLDSPAILPNSFMKRADPLREEQKRTGKRF